MSSVIHNEYAVNYQSGPWYYYLQGLWILTPFSTVFCLFGASVAVMYGRFIKDPSETDNGRRRALAGIALFMIAFIVIATIPQYLKNLRYISPVFGIFYLVSGFGFWCAVSFIRRTAKGALAAAIVSVAVIITIAASLSDYGNFTRIFVKGGAIDIVNRLIGV